MFAVGNKEGKIQLYKSGINSGQHRVYPSKYCGNGTQEAFMTTIDKWFFDDILDQWRYPIRIDFVKMDAEGSEYDVLLGMIETIRRNRPAIMLEFHPDSIREYGTEPKDTFNLLRSIGYRIYLTDDVLVGRTRKHWIEQTDYNKLEELTNIPIGGKNLLCISEGTELYT
jgi:hypothetical protein